MLQTEYEFTLPIGFQDEDGTLHREGTMRLATAADEILPLKDARVQGNPAYLSVIVLSRVLSRLGAVPQVTPKVIEGLYAADMAYLQALYNRLNDVDAQGSQMCPNCSHVFGAEHGLGGSPATLSASSTRR
jgi:hypothetical protein